MMRAASDRVDEVRAYGEIVDLLWQAGNVQGTIELERLWNELISELDFTLLCGYHSGAALSPEHEHSLGEVCRLHSAVSVAPGAQPPAVRNPGAARELSRQFVSDEHAPSAARRFAEHTLQGWGHDGSVIDDARLLISELVTNAVIHTRGPFSVSICSRPPKLRVAVHDCSTELPTADWRPPNPPTGGRGLRIVAALADDWGVASTPPGKTVWAVLSAD
jgi:anti-sigma regulatory factor (Ser/Thr protein kinase)